MAGDHKCPVCNSTFTRPQHVARHMRSHTGDRPYKCQHCGDQFARSDLLSRHVNKCHASEKPPTTTTPSNRRKGPTAASRATTSKQACDQCVQSSLPCDGCNPCSKCVQRKSRCTYVKFHRQTAPQGPGHPPPSALPPHHPHAHHARTSSASTSASTASTSRIPDEFVLGPPPGTTSLPAIYAQNQHAQLSHQYASADYIPYGGYGTQRDNSASGLSGPAATRDPSESLVDGGSPDLMARYRGSADLYRAPSNTLGMTVGGVPTMVSGGGMLPNGTILPPPHSSSTVLPGIYDIQHVDNRYGGGAGWGHSFPIVKEREYGASTGGRLPFPVAAGGGGGGGASSTHSSSVQTHPSTQQTAQPHQNTGTNQQHSQDSPQLGHTHHAHGPPQFTDDSHKQFAPRDQHHQFAREHQQYQQFPGSSTERQHDAFPTLSPSLSFSLNPRKEMNGSDYDNMQAATDRFGNEASISSTGSSNTHFSAMDRSRSRIFAFDATQDGVLGKDGGMMSDGSGTNLVVRGMGEGGFSSAFGLMSLDDPNVLAGLAADGTPFFSKIDGANASGSSKRYSTSEGTTSITDASTSDKTPGDASSTSLSISNNANSLTQSLGLGTPGSMVSKEEMKEFWRQYMRTPFSSTGASTPLFGSLLTPTAGGNHLQLGAGLADGRPGPPSRRHSRVASLPSLKTPTYIGLSEFGLFDVGGPNHSGHGVNGQAAGNHASIPTFHLNIGGASKKYKDPQQSYQQQPKAGQASPGQGVGTGVRGTLYDKEDLKSYEQAVLARRGVTELKIVPKRRGTVASGAPSVSSINSTGNKLPLLSNRPSTAGDSTSTSIPNLDASTTTVYPSSSSLADAFGRSGSASGSSVGDSSGSSASPPALTDSSTGQRSYVPEDRDSPTPRAAKLDRDSPMFSPIQSNFAHDTPAHEHTSLSPPMPPHMINDPQAGCRPSFKRLASQSLGPDNAKRALLGPAGWEDDDDPDDDEEDSSEDDRFGERGHRSGSSQQQQQHRKYGHGVRPIRRMSCPTTTRSPGNLVLPPIKMGGTSGAERRSPG